MGLVRKKAGITDNWHKPVGLVRKRTGITDKRYSKKMKNRYKFEILSYA